METFADFLRFLGGWVGAMALIGICLYITGKFFRKGGEETVNPEEYAKKFEEEMNELTPEKPIKEKHRNPFVLSSDEIKETKEETEKE